MHMSGSDSHASSSCKFCKNNHHRSKGEQAEGEGSQPVNDSYKEGIAVDFSALVGDGDGTDYNIVQKKQHRNGGAEEDEQAWKQMLLQVGEKLSVLLPFSGEEGVELPKVMAQ